MGVDGVDTDLPTRLELLLLNNVAGKTFFWSVGLLVFQRNLTDIQHIPNPFLCASPWHSPGPETDGVARCQRILPTLI
jgi:hypothetical protein